MIRGRHPYWKAAIVREAPHYYGGALRFGDDNYDLEDRYTIKDVQPDLEEGECLFDPRFAIIWNYSAIVRGAPSLAYGPILLLFSF